MRGGKVYARIKWDGLTLVSALDMGENLAATGCKSIWGTFIFCGIGMTAELRL